MTVLTLIQSSLRLIGQLTPGRGAGASELVDALFVLNAMLEGWATDRLNIYQIGRDVYTLTAGNQTYTIGPSGTFNTTRPIRIENAGLLIGNLEYPLKMMTADEWAGLALKTTTASLPAAIYNDNAFPLATLSFFPIPTTAVQVALYPWRALTSFAATTDVFTMPPGYLDAVRYNLAVRLAPEWGKVPRADVLQMARDTLGAIEALNSPTPVMFCDSGVLRSSAGGQDVSLFGGGTTSAGTITVFSVANGQTVLTTTAWANATIYRNGLLQTPGVDYSAVTAGSTVYTFVVPFVNTDSVSVVHS